MVFVVTGIGDAVGRGVVNDWVGGCGEVQPATPRERITIIPRIRKIFFIPEMEA
jgi:hypothetical protein